MAAQKQKIVILGGGLRGLYLASLLSQKSYPVQYLELAGYKYPSIEPFGYFAEDLHDEFSVFLQNIADLSPCPTGFTVWSEQGPVEMRGPLSNFSLDQRGISYTLSDALKKVDHFSFQEKKEFVRAMQSLDMSQNWLTALSAHLANSIYDADRSINIHQQLLPLFNPYYLVRFSENKIKNYMDQQTFKTQRDIQIKDISLVGKTIDAIEISGMAAGVLKGDYFVWLGSSEDTTSLNPTVAKRLFPRNAVSPAWSWTHFSVQLSQGPEVEALPQNFTLIQNLYLPWTHSHISLFQKGEAPGTYHVWFRIAHSRKFQRTYLEQTCQQIVDELQRRIPALEVKIEKMPPEFSRDRSELGMNPYSVYEQPALDKLKLSCFKNLIYACPEQQSGLDLLSMKRFEIDIYQKILKMTEMKKKNDQEVQPGRDGPSLD